MNKYERVPLAEIIEKYDIKGVHPSADLLPMASEEEFQAGCRDVESNGFLESIKITDDGLLLDGRNRLQIAWAVNLDPPVERINPSNPASYIISENVHRRHLSVGQIAIIAKKIATLPPGNPKFGRNGSATTEKERVLHQLFRTEELEHTSQKTVTEDVAELLGISTKAISQASTIKHWAPRRR